MAWLAFSLAGCFLLLGTASNARAEDFDQAARQLSAAYAAALEELAAWCDQRGLKDQAKKTRAWFGPRDPMKLYLAVLPKQAGASPLPADAPRDVVEWDLRLARLKRDQANALYELARRAVRTGRASLAYELVLAAIRENPDHEAVRRLMGYQKLKGQWYSIYEIRKLRAGQVWHEQFGWLLPAHLRRYEQGQRYLNGKWISAEEDARLHRDIQSGWDVETEHYTIRTNHSLESGVQLGVKLEELYRVWQQLFVRYYASEAEVVALFDGRARIQQIELPRHQVVYFRDQEDYNRSLRAAFPNIAISSGVYLQQAQRAYFFAGQQQDDRTLYHEATHQLFHESRPVAPDVGKRANLWIVEGIAMYMESLHREGDFQVLGGPDDERMRAARYRLLHDGFYVPLSELTAYGMEKMQTDPRIATLYSQAAGLTHFLVCYGGGRYRDALVAYLAAVYNGRDEPATLAQLTGTTYAELDRQYREFMQSSAQQVSPGRQPGVGLE